MNNNPGKTPITSSYGNVNLREELNQEELENLIVELYLDNANFFIEVLRKNLDNYSDLFEILDKHPLFLKLLKKHAYNESVTELDFISRNTTDKIYKIIDSCFNEYYRLSDSNPLLNKIWNSFFEAWLSKVDMENTSPQKMLELSDEVMESLGHPKQVLN